MPCRPVFTEDLGLDLFDGPCIFDFLKEAYLQSFVLPDDFYLDFKTQPINWGDVYIGITSAQELHRLYAQYGKSLFFENIRDYLYEDDQKTTEVNFEIIETVRTAPEKMLARNNGIVIKAQDVTLDKDQLSRLLIRGGSIVNGVQTTMSIVEHMEPDTTDCVILAKVVKTSSAWDVARAANRQNEVGKLELQIAEFLRPQRIKKAAATRSIAIESNDSPLAILDSIYRKSVIYDDMRSLFIGIFSRSPGNLFGSDRSEMLTSILEQFFKNDPDGDQLFENLFTIQLASTQCMQSLKERLTTIAPAGVYQRFFKDNTFAYRAFLSILGACAASETDISQGNTDEERFEIRMRFLENAIAVIENDLPRYELSYREAFKVIVAKLLAE